MPFYMRDANDANSTDDYRPKTTPEKAGARGGTNAAVSADPNFVFASTLKVNRERTPYPVGSPGDTSALDTVAAVECDATLKV